MLIPKKIKESIRSLENLNHINKISDQPLIAKRRAGDGVGFPIWTCCFFFDCPKTVVFTVIF